MLFFTTKVLFKKTRSQIQLLWFQKEIHLHLNLALYLNLWVDWKVIFFFFYWHKWNLLLVFPTPFFRCNFYYNYFRYNPYNLCTVAAFYVQPLYGQRQKGNKTDKYSASRELLFAGALEHNLLFPLPSRGGFFTFPPAFKRAGNTQEKLKWCSPHLLPAQGFEAPPCSQGHSLMFWCFGGFVIATNFLQPKHEFVITPSPWKTNWNKSAVTT